MLLKLFWLSSSTYIINHNNLNNLINLINHLSFITLIRQKRLILMHHEKFHHEKCQNSTSWKISSARTSRNICFSLDLLYSQLFFIPYFTLFPTLLYSQLYVIPNFILDQTWVISILLRYSRFIWPILFPASRLNLGY